MAALWAWQDWTGSSGAVGLYTAAGFEIDERFAAWRKPMETT